jgi:hypothetical protein
MHAPPTHVWLVHATGLPQLPVESQVSTALLVHRFVPCTQATADFRRSSVLTRANAQRQATVSWHFERVPIASS